jgi:hypothetical protein
MEVIPTDGCRSGNPKRGPEQLRPGPFACPSFPEPRLVETRMRDASPLSGFPTHNNALRITVGEGVKLVQELPGSGFEVAFHDYPIPLTRLPRTPTYRLIGVP